MSLGTAQVDYLLLFPSKAWSVAYCFLRKFETCGDLILPNDKPLKWVILISIHFVFTWKITQKTKWSKLCFLMGRHEQFSQFVLVLVPVVIFYMWMLYRSDLHCVFGGMVCVNLNQAVPSTQRSFDSMDVRSEWRVVDLPWESGLLSGPQLDFHKTKELNEVICKAEILKPVISNASFL